MKHVQTFSMFFKPSASELCFCFDREMVHLSINGVFHSLFHPPKGLFEEKEVFFVKFLPLNEDCFNALILSEFRDSVLFSAKFFQCLEHVSLKIRFLGETENLLAV